MIKTTSIIMGTLLAVGLASPSYASEYNDYQERAAESATKLLVYYNAEQERISKELMHIQSNYLVKGVESVERKRISKWLVPKIIKHRYRSNLLNKLSAEDYVQRLGYTKVSALTPREGLACAGYAEALSFRPALATVKHRVEVKKLAAKTMNGIGKRSLSDNEGRRYNLRVSEIINSKVLEMENEVLSKVDAIMKKCKISK